MSGAAPTAPGARTSHTIQAQSLGTPDSEGQPEQEWHPGVTPVTLWHLLLPIWSPLGSSHSWVSFGSFLCLFRPKIRENLSGTNQSEHIRAFGSLHSSPVPHRAPARRKKKKKSSLVSGRHPDLELQGQHIHRAPEGRTMLHTLICSGDPALAEGILQRKPHTQLASQGCRDHTSLSWQCCIHRKASGEEDVLCHCLFFCPALTRSWFCPNTLFTCTKEGLFPPLQDPFSSPKHRLGNKDCWEAAWSGTEERAVVRDV